MNDTLATLAQRAAETASTAVYLWRDGDTLFDWSADGYGGEPIETMSVTKSVVSLAIGRLIAMGLLDGLDTPVHDLYPEWRQGRKREITIRHLMSHTSGMQNEPRTDIEIYPSPDFVRLALAAELSHAPGATFAYNNKAVNLLAGVVQVASGRRLDEFMAAEVFAPLGITRYEWTCDAAGNPHAMSGLELRPPDLARIGALVLRGGDWDGVSVVPKTFIDECLDAGPRTPECGLLWWRDHDRVRRVLDAERLDEWAAAGVPDRLVRPLRALASRPIDVADWDATLDDDMGLAEMAAALGSTEAVEELRAAVAERGLRGSRVEWGEVVSYSANGYLGQWLVLVPSTGTVGVRLREYDEDPDDARNFRGFGALVREVR